MICKPWDIVVIPFPFVESSQRKPRPALILSRAAFQQHNDCAIAAMITSAAHSQWFGDTLVTALKGTGLTKPCIIRLKLFTLDMKLRPRVIGRLQPADTETFRRHFTSATELA